MHMVRVRGGSFRRSTVSLFRLACWRFSSSVHFPHHSFARLVK